MTGFSDLVDDASTTEGGRLANVNFDGTEGRTWRWVFDGIVDHDGNPVDFTSGTTQVCKIISDVDGSDLLTLTFTGALGGFTISALPAATAGLAVGATRVKPRQCSWYLRITKGAEQLQVWGPSDSIFRVFPE